MTVQMSQSLYDRLTIKTFIHAIRTDCVSILKPHVLSAKFLRDGLSESIIVVCILE